MKDYKILLEDLGTKERRIIYLGANSIASCKLMVAGAHPTAKAVSVVVNRELSVKYYCNRCHTEQRVADKATHSC